MKMEDVGRAMEQVGIPGRDAYDLPTVGQLGPADLVIPKP